MNSANRRIQTLLVANRGEIACRIIRTANKIGLKTIAVYSDVDEHAVHVELADDAYRLGSPPAKNSYLSIEKIIDAAKAANADGVHPGYGFLAENAQFAEACRRENIIFVGPSPQSIELMGDKAKAKRRMIAAGVPCVPGYEGEDQTDATLIKRADEIGFPIMVKATAGGGGRGMRLVENRKNLESALQAARSEAENAFGRGGLILERAIVRPRHVEIQIIGDQYGKIIHLGERDCSVQRRHQKVLEEAPCPIMTPELRDAMGDAAIKAALEINYVGAGTVEFLLDRSGEFFFLEMNTRLQVEHPVTEMVTGIDIVSMQLQVAQGEPLNVEQSEIRLTGHAIEARLYAENTGSGFLPATGPVDLWLPAVGDGIRIDAGIKTEDEISPFYDPLVAKIIAHGGTRDDARLKLISALEKSTLFGVATNKGFLIDALRHPDFANGGATTAFIAEAFKSDALAAPELRNEYAIAAAILLFIESRNIAMENAILVSPTSLNWASASRLVTSFCFPTEDRNIEIGVDPTSSDSYLAHINDTEHNVIVKHLAKHQAILSIDTRRLDVFYNVLRTGSAPTRIQFNINGYDFDLTNSNAIIHSSSTKVDFGSIVAPMHGVLLEILVKHGQRVTKGERVAILEAMKMQHELIAEGDGVVSKIFFESGAQVAANAVLMELSADD